MIRWTSKAVKIWKKCEISDSWKCRLSRRRASASDYRMSRHNRDRQAGHLTTYSSDVDTGRGSRPHGTATFCRRPCVIRVNRPTYIEDISNSIIFFLFCINIFKEILRKKNVQNRIFLLGIISSREKTRVSHPKIRHKLINSNIIFLIAIKSQGSLKFKRNKLFFH